MSHEDADRRVNTPARWELWETIHSDGTQQLSFFPEWNDNSRQSLDASARLIWTVEAENYDDAMQKHNDFLGWGPYKPIPVQND